MSQAGLEPESPINDVQILTWCFTLLSVVFIFLVVIFCLPEHSDIISCPIEGSPLYLAPETVTRQPIGREVDIWACAVIFYTMLVSIRTLISTLTKFFNVIGLVITSPI